MEGEVWEDIKGYEGKYSVSCFGKIMRIGRKLLAKRYKGRIQTNIIMRPKIDKGGYLQLVLFKESKYKDFQVHRLVGQAFIPNPENKPCINHKDGNKLNNNIENLEWVTSKENIHHAWRTGLHLPSDKWKLSLEQANEIRQKYFSTFGSKYHHKNSAYKLAREYNVNQTTILQIVNNKRYINEN